MRNKTRSMKRRTALIALLFALVLQTELAYAQPHQPPQNPLESSTPTEQNENGTVTLEDLLRAARENNPELKAAMHAAQAKRARIPAEKTLPDPMVIFQSMGDPIPGKLMKGDPSSARTIGVEQEIPFPGKLGLKGKIAEVEAQVEELNHTQVHRKLTSDIKQAYYDLFVIRESMDIVRKDKDLLQNFEQIAEKKYQVGEGIQQDVLKAQVEISRLIDRLVVLDQKRVVSEAQINNLLYRPQGTPVGKPAEFPKAELGHSLDELTKMARNNSTALQTREREINSRQLSVRLAEKQYYPDFSLGFTYFDREDQPEMYGWMLKATVPLYFWRKQGPELESAKANLMSARMMRENTQSTIESQVKQFYVEASSSDRLVKLYGNAIVPQSSLALDSAIASYQVGKTDFLTLIDSLTNLLEFQIKYYESLGDFQKALARMEPLVGVDLTK